MLYIIVSSDSETRIKKRASIFSELTGEPISIDDATSSLVGLEEYIYPSLFSIGVPVVHGKYLIGEYAADLTKELLQKLVASPTVFVLEEQAISTPLIKTIEKEGATVYREDAVKQLPKPNTIFGVTNAITAPHKKDRWLAYISAKNEHAPEALIGILYWKLRDLIEKAGTKNSFYKTMYTKLIHAHKDAWQKGFPLSLAIEKVILENE